MNFALYFLRNVSPLNLARVVLKTIPVKKGNFELIVRFSSTQLSNVLGDEDVTVNIIL